MKKEITLVLLLIMVGFSTLTAQVKPDLPLTKPIVPYFPELTGIQSYQPPFLPNINKIPGQYTITDWRTLIDAY